MKIGIIVVVVGVLFVMPLVTAVYGQDTSLQELVEERQGGGPNDVELEMKQRYTPKILETTTPSGAIQRTAFIDLENRFNPVAFSGIFLPDGLRTLLSKQISSSHALHWIVLLVISLSWRLFSSQVLTSEY